MPRNLGKLYFACIVILSLFFSPFSAQTMTPSPSVDFEFLGFCKNKGNPSQHLVLRQKEPSTPAVVPKFEVYSDDDETPLEVQLLSLEEEERSPRENYAQGLFAYTQKSITKLSNASFVPPVKALKKIRIERELPWLMFRIDSGITILKKESMKRHAIFFSLLQITRTHLPTSI